VRSDGSAGLPSLTRCPIFQGGKRIAPCGLVRAGFRYAALAALSALEAAASLDRRHSAAASREISTRFPTRITRGPSPAAAIWKYFAGENLCRVQNSGMLLASGSLSCITVAPLRLTAIAIERIRPNYSAWTAFTPNDFFGL
jgi:hypothetical protein